MNKIKILLTGMSDNLGGIETYIYNLYKNADKEKFEFSFLVFDYGKKVCYEKELEKKGVKFYKITPRTKNYFKFLKDLKEVYKNNKFDYIHFNLMDFSCFERITYANKYSKAKIIIHSHCGSSNYLKGNHLRTAILNKLGKYKIRKIPYIRAACGKQAGEYMFGLEEYLIFNNGIDLEKFKYNQASRQQIRSGLNIKNDTIVIGLIAAFLPVKNHSFLIEIFSEIIKQKKNYKLVLIGIGPTQDKIKHKVKELNIEEKVLFLGKRTDVDKIYSALDIYLMPSISEGLSISLLEAQVNGLKCYTSSEVDKNSNITGNVEFISLKNTAKEWANIIINSNNKRDKDVVKKVSEEYNAKKSYEKLFNYYIENKK